MNDLRIVIHNLTSSRALNRWREIIQRLYVAKVPKVALTLISIGFAGAVLVFLLYRDRQLLADFQWDIHWLSLIGALGCTLACMLWAAMIWGRIMDLLGSQVTLAQHIRCYALSQLVKRLPGTIWYVASRGHLYQEYGEPLRLVAMASGVEFILLFVSGAFITLLLSLFALPDTYRYVQGILIVVLLLGISLIQPRTIRWLRRCFKLSDAPDLRQSVILRWVGAYLLLWLIGGAMYFLLLNAFIRIDGEHFLYVITSWCLVGTLSFFVFFCLRIWALMK